MTENDGVRESSKNFYISIIYQEATGTPGKNQDLLG